MVDERTIMSTPWPSGEVTLRDWFAAFALQGEIVACGGDADLCLAVGEKAMSLNRDVKEHLCVVAYEYADTMMKARDGWFDKGK